MVLWIFSAPLSSNILLRTVEGWEDHLALENMITSDVIVVLSSGRMLAPGNSLVSEWGDADRFYGGIDLFNSRKAPYLIFTSGVSEDDGMRPEGEILRNYALQLGVPSEKIFVTEVATNTAEEAKVTANLMRQLRQDNKSLELSKVILVTSAFHMKRAKYLFEKEGVPIIPYPVDFRVRVITSLRFNDILPSASALRNSELAMHEIYGFLYCCALDSITHIK